MPINRYELEIFSNRWLQKSRDYREDSLSDLFDKFFTLYVAYNRVYVEAGKVLISTNHPVVRKYISNKIYSRKAGRSFFPVSPLPDRFGATKIIPAFLTSKDLKAHLETYCSQDVKYMTSTIQGGRFYFHYDYVSNAPDLEKDIQVATKANAFDPTAVLDLVYTARCNMFHGSKEFHDVQAPLLRAMNSILESTINLALNKLLERSA